nr:MAG TPA: hypothetical protein [Caudoviricetes sp.]
MKLTPFCNLLIYMASKPILYFSLCFLHFVKLIY